MKIALPRHIILTALSLTVLSCSKMPVFIKDDTPGGSDILPVTYVFTPTLIIQDGTCDGLDILSRPEIHLLVESEDDNISFNATYSIDGEEPYICAGIFPFSAVMLSEGLDAVGYGIHSVEASVTCRESGETRTVASVFRVRDINGTATALEMIDGLGKEREIDGTYMWLYGGEKALLRITPYNPKDEITVSVSADGEYVLSGEPEREESGSFLVPLTGVAVGQGSVTLTVSVLDEPVDYAYTVTVLGVPETQPRLYVCRGLFDYLREPFRTYAGRKHYFNIIPDPENIYDYGRSLRCYPESAAEIRRGPGDWEGEPDIWEVTYRERGPIELTASVIRDREYTQTYHGSIYDDIPLLVEITPEWRVYLSVSEVLKAGETIPISAEFTYHGEVTADVSKQDGSHTNEKTTLKTEPKTVKRTYSFSGSNLGERTYIFNMSDEMYNTSRESLGYYTWAQNTDGSYYEKYVEKECNPVYDSLVLRLGFIGEKDEYVTFSLSSSSSRNVKLVFGTD